MRTHAAAFLEAASAGDLNQMSKTNNLFHIAIAQASRNRHLVSMHRALMPGCLRLTHTVLTGLPREGESYEIYYRRVLEEHDRMVDAITRRDPEAAALAARDHADLTRSRVTQFIQMTLATATPVGDPETAGELLQRPTKGPRVRQAAFLEQDQPGGDAPSRSGADSSMTHR